MPIDVEAPPLPSGMALSLRRNSTSGSVGLDIDGRFLAAVQSDGSRIIRAASSELPPGLVRDGEVADPDALGAAIKDFAGEAGLPKNVRIGVANQQIVVRPVELPRIENDAEREAAIRFQAAEAIAMPLDEAVLDHQVTGFDESPDGTKRMQVVLVAARRAMIESYVDAVKRGGLKPEGIDLDAFALVRILARNAPPADNARVFCHLAGVTNLAVAIGEICLFTRPLSSVWDGEHAAAELADEIRLSIDYYMAQPNAQPVEDVMLSGPGSRRDEFVDELHGHLALPTRVAEPLGGLDGSALNAGDDPWRYTVAAGLALGAAA
jgi:type IV pilus assembly protein PilM